MTSSVRNPEVFEGEKVFNIYRRHRSSRSGGGLLITVGVSIDSFSVHVNCDLEVALTCLSVGHKKSVLDAC